LDALSSPEELFSKAKDLGMKALAITDHGTFAGIWESYKIAKKKDIKLIVGCEFFFKRDPKQTHFNHVILLAKNAEGYRNMLSLNFEAFSNSPDNTKRKYIFYASRFYKKKYWKKIH
jgi:DNA polymerase-3 subunit alpha